MIGGECELRNRHAATALILFDIDGTLIRRAGPEHRAALEGALLRVTGLRATTDGIPVQGMLDRDILRAMLGAAGLRGGGGRRDGGDSARGAAAVPENVPGFAGEGCPGARRLLRLLRRRGVPAGLVTGNLSRIGWRKMERTGLRGYFRVGAFANRAARGRSWPGGRRPRRGGGD